MKIYKILSIFLVLLLVSSNSYAKTKIAKKSSGVHCGVRYYLDALPEDIKYKSLGNIEAQARGGMALEEIMNSILALCVKAKLMGANAVIKVTVNSPSQGEAIIAESFPDEYTEDDFKKFKGPEKFSKSKIFKYEYSLVFNLVEQILKDEFYDITISDAGKGLIKTKPIETSNGIRGMMKGGPYPITSLLINIKDLGDGTTEITENYIFHKGKVNNVSMLITSNATFFKTIEKELKQLSKNKN